MSQSILTGSISASPVAKSRKPAAHLTNFRNRQFTFKLPPPADHEHQVNSHPLPGQKKLKGPATPPRIRGRWSEESKTSVPSGRRRLRPSNGVPRRKGGGL